MIKKNLNTLQTQKQFRSVQESFAQAAEARDGLQAQKRLADHTIEELQSKLSDESTARRLLEQSLGTLRLELEDVRNEKVQEFWFLELMMAGSFPGHLRHLMRGLPRALILHHKIY